MIFTSVHDGKYVTADKSKTDITKTKHIPTNWKDIWSVTWKYGMSVAVTASSTGSNITHWQWLHHAVLLTEQHQFCHLQMHRKYLPHINNINSSAVTALNSPLISWSVSAEYRQSSDIIMMNTHHSITLDSTLYSCWADGRVLGKLTARHHVDRQVNLNVLLFRLVHHLLNDLGTFLVKQRLADLLRHVSQTYQLRIGLYRIYIFPIRPEPEFQIDGNFTNLTCKTLQTYDWFECLIIFCAAVTVTTFLISGFLLF